MIAFANGGHVLKAGETLPDFRKYPYLFIDFETTSFDNLETSLNPWKIDKCGVAGVAVTASTTPNKDGRFAESIYIPCEHHDIFTREHGGNIDLKWVLSWLIAQLTPSKDCQEKFWVNHNIKFDVCVLANNCWRVGLPFDLEQFDVYGGLKYVDTLTLSRIIDSDRFTYSLEGLAKDWLGAGSEKYTHSLKAYLPTKGKRTNKDYGEIPIDVLGEYACQDVLINRELFEYIYKECPEQCGRVWHTEIDVTRELLEIEFEGMRIKPKQLKNVEAAVKLRLMKIRNRIEEIIGYDIEPNNNGDCYDVLVCSYGLPVIEYTDTKNEGNNFQGNPSFTKSALEKYQNFDNAPEELLELMLEYRELFTLNSLFVEPYQVLHRNGRLHPDYKQTLRTGRMGCGRPNMQQLSKIAKKLIFADEDCVILSIDYSQIEFRLIVHYINSLKAIHDYITNPDTDFHQWVADNCGIDRQPAKAINFMLGFGGGKKKTVAMLSRNKKLVAAIYERVAHVPEEHREEAFNMLANRRAEEVYNTYHGELPGIKIVSKKAENSCRRRGYVFNLYGRRRHLPKQRCHIAFNTLNQGSAADLLKDRVVRLGKALRRFAKTYVGPKAKLIGVVHDEFVFKIPKAVFTEQLVKEILYILETPDVKLRVPIRCSAGYSSKTWHEANTITDIDDSPQNLSKIKRLQSTAEFKHLKFVQPECNYGMEKTATAV